jgi:hypothetical protein
VTGAPPDRDAGLEAFVDAIEAALRARRGKDHVLSPQDFALSRSWHAAGVPLASVLVAIDAAFERDPSTSSLARCRRRVEELAAGGARAAASGPDRGGGGGGSLPEVGERLDALRERLLELPGRAVALPLAELVEVRDLVAVASRPNWDYLRERLRRIDALVGQAAVEALPAPAAAALREETIRAAERHRGKVDERALEEAASRLLRQRAREVLRLPRVSTD